MPDRQPQHLPKWFRSQPTAVVLCTLVVIVYGVSSLLPMPHGYHELLVAVFTGTIALLMISALVRHHRAVAELQAREEELAEQSALLQNTLENMGEGLSVFDRDGRLIAWNTRFTSLVKAPIEANTQLVDVLYHQAARGDFGPVEDPEREAKERAGRFYRNLPSVTERTTAAGHVLQIRRRAMPDGGVVSL